MIIYPLFTQVGGDVYAVNDHTFHIRNFMYDGNGKDTFFWAGSLPRPGPQGFIVPNERGRWGCWISI